VQSALRAPRSPGQLFQDLEPFRIDEYVAVDDPRPLKRLRALVEEMVAQRGGTLAPDGDARFSVRLNGQPPVTFTTARDEALANERLQLLGIDHPIVEQLLDEATGLPADQRALLIGQTATWPDADIRTVWEVTIGDAEGRTSRRLYELTMRNGQVTSCRPYEGEWPPDVALSAVPPAPRDRAVLVEQTLPAALREALTERGELPAGASYKSQLLVWIEVTA
jgi:hypothetical protein